MADRSTERRRARRAAELPAEPARFPAEASARSSDELIGEARCCRLPWLALVRIQDLLLPVAGSEGADTPAAAERARGYRGARSKATRRFALPASEEVIDSMLCLVHRARRNRGVAARGAAGVSSALSGFSSELATLYLTQVWATTLSMNANPQPSSSPSPSTSPKPSPKPET